MPTPIFDTLQRIREGDLLEEASIDLQELIQAIKDTNKGGELRLTLKISPFKNNADKVLILGTCAIKKPAIEPSPDLFYTTDDANLSQRNPRQRDLDLREVDMETGELIDPDAQQAG